MSTNFLVNSLGSKDAIFTHGYMLMTPLSNARLLALQYSNAVKTYQFHYSNRVFTVSQKYNFDVYQITITGGKFNIFSGEDTDKKVHLRMHQNTPFQVNIYFLWGGVYRLPRPLPGGKGYPLTTPHSSSPPRLLNPPRAPRISTIFTPVLLLSSCYWMTEVRWVAIRESGLSFSRWCGD